MRFQNFPRLPVQASNYPHRKIVFTSLCLDGISCILVFYFVPIASFSFSGLTLPFITTFHQIFTHIGKILHETTILQAEQSQFSTSPPTRDGHSLDSLQHAHILLVLGSPTVSYQCQVQRKDCHSPPAGDTFLDSPGYCWSPVL